MSTPKTVYILGAGFSINGGGPRQDEIMSEIWKLPDDPDTIAHKNEFRKFLKENLNVDEIKVSLEDIYTPIDRCLADGLSFKNLTEGDLLSLRNKIDYLISLAIQNRFRTGPVTDSLYVPKFAKYLVEKAAVRATKAIGITDKKEAKEYDPFSIISLNWDILLDDDLNDALKNRDGKVKDDYAPFGVVDYCCYISSLKDDDRRIRTGLWTLGCRGYNIKLLKLHGSMNWLQCPNCQQLFVGFDEKNNIVNYTNPQPCRHCEKQGNTSPLRGSLVMPTFLKDLSNFQVKLIWQNAGVELMEARRLVFVGYSLPQADFEFRQLILRMVNKDAKIEVYLWDRVASYTAEKKRYKDFFSHYDVNVRGGGAAEFVQNETSVAAVP
jgi:hypothetical protein